MKKILSVVLAVALLSTMAMAADVTLGTSSTLLGVNPGQSLGAKVDSFGLTNLGAGNNLELGYRFNSENFSVSSKTFSKGANLVDEVVMSDDDMEVQIKLKSDYSLSRPDMDPTKAPANLVIKKLAVKAKKNIDIDGVKDAAGKLTNEVAKNAEFVYGGPDEFKVGYAIDPANGIINDGTASYVNGEMVKFTSDTENYATADMTQDEVYLEGRVYKNDKVFVEVKPTPSDDGKAVMKENGDAEMSFYRVITNGFPSNNTIQLSVDKENFVYQVKDGKLVESGLKWSDDDYAFVGKIRSSTKYVVSDIELTYAPATSEGEAAPEVPNPGTGANDVVGIAAALAVVSLVAAGAVSLKK